MAKQRYEAAEEVAEALPTPHLTTIQLEIPGLAYTPTWDERTSRTRDIFTLEGVPEVNVDWMAIEQMLKDQGIDQSIVSLATEEFCQRVSTLTIANHLAKRMKRVG
jgi:hypothetical protein